MRPPPLDCGSALFVDVDGTLLEIAARPELVRVPPGLPALFDRLAAERGGALALVSGRRLADLDCLFRPWRGAAAGLHGGEIRRADGGIRGEEAIATNAAAMLDQLRPRLRDWASRFPGVWLEDKGAALALHYRGAPEKSAEIGDLADRLRREAGDGLRLIAGKMVLELLPCGCGKGGAVAALLAEPPFCGRRPVYLGDDTTDEDAFAEVNRRKGLSIRVGEPEAGTAAVFRLSSVAAVHAWLAAGGPE